MSIRKLDPSNDLDLYRICWQWFQDLPKWAHDVLAVYSVGTFDEYLELANGPRTNIGIFDGETFVGVITMEMVAKDIYELHLSTARRPPVGIILEAMVNVMRIAFEEMGAQTGFSFTPRHDKGIVVMLRAIGMRQDGVEKLRGVSRNKVVRWTRSIITKDDYWQQVKAA